MNNEDAMRWKKALGDEEFRAKFPEAALKLAVDDAIESLKKGDATFMELHKQGLELDIDDYIDEWHNGDSNKELHEYLGMTWDEYKIYLETDTLPE